MERSNGKRSQYYISSFDNISCPCILGRYNDKFDVAVKLSSYVAPWIKETNALMALDAMKDSNNIEKEDVPHVYYHGLIYGIHPVIAMTLFDGSLNDLFERYKGDISDLQILEIFKQAVCIIFNFNNCCYKNV